MGFKRYYVGLKSDNTHYDNEKMQNIALLHTADRKINLSTISGGQLVNLLKAFKVRIC